MEQQLYQLVAPLVMDPVVIRANNNYPFKTNDNYVWFIATEEDKVVGFLPLELRKSQKVIINNYYVVSDNEIRKNILSALLSAALDVFSSGEWLFTSVALIQDKDIFEKFGFILQEKKWKLYVKMIR